MSNRTFNEEAYRQRKAFLKKPVEERAAFMQTHCNRFNVAMTRLHAAVVPTGWVSRSFDSHGHRTQKQAVRTALRDVAEEAKHLDKFLAFDLLDANKALKLVGDKGLVGGTGTIVQLASKLGHLSYSEIDDSTLREAVDWLLEPQRFALLAGVASHRKVWSGRTDQDIELLQSPNELLADDAVHLLSAMLLLDERGAVHSWNFRWGNPGGPLASHYSEDKLGCEQPPPPSQNTCPGFTWEGKVQYQPIDGDGEVIESIDYMKMGTFTLKSVNLGKGYYCVQGRVYGRGNFIFLLKGQYRLDYHNIRDFSGNLDQEVFNIALTHPATVSLLDRLSKSIPLVTSPEHDHGIAVREDEAGTIVRCWLECDETMAEICFRKTSEGEPVIKSFVQDAKPFVHPEAPPLDEPARRISADDPTYTYSNLHAFSERFSEQLKRD